MFWLPAVIGSFRDSKREIPDAEYHDYAHAFTIIRKSIDYRNGYIALYLLAQAIHLLQKNVP
jgi:hypothetical protein